MKSKKNSQNQTFSSAPRKQTIGMLCQAMRRYEENKGDQCRLVVSDGKFQFHDNPNWFTVYTKMETGWPSKQKQGLFTKILKNLPQEQQKAQKGKSKSQVYQTSKAYCHKQEIKKQNYEANKENHFDLPLESNIEKEDSNFQHFTLSFNSLGEEGVGDIKHQLAQKKQFNKKKPYQETNFMKPFAQEMVVEESHESLQKIVQCLNQTLTKPKETKDTLIRNKEERKDETISTRRISYPEEESSIETKKNPQQEKEERKLQVKCEIKGLAQKEVNEIQFDLSLDF